MKKLLPIGKQDFEKLIQGDYLYVDKTRYLLDLIEQGDVFFLSRPRRYGKSLTLSTFKAIFEGKKELFDGLQELLVRVRFAILHRRLREASSDEHKPHIPHLDY